ncbi:Glutaredoxin-2, mitochondrial [Seminavis robusta]|uniref:Glutaredoxin-2, mitochondrial n=1 Tax=Seminavis robusta TaxID=568900 RepID=A0A9N8F303_9STRA|nr:Glutaredoxin-2, mitochondrial [Seminavis robusta]|eukprot:Sro2612_g332620.1 Glutaredoxin-2, mitochondrial (265) ;mRNA; r:11900-12694
MESIFTSNDIVVVSKTSCPYCKAVKALLTEELNLTPKILEVNVEGPAALEYAKSITGISTVPQVFVENKFVGTHDDVMSLDAKGQLEPLVKKFMKGPRKAKTASSGTSGTLLWFPPKVNKSAIRTTGVLSCGIALTSAVLMYQNPQDPTPGYIAAGLFGDYTLRFMAGSKFSPVAQLGGMLASSMDVIFRPGAPKQFATVCGMMFSGLGAAMFLNNSAEIGCGFMSVLALCAGMEGFLDFCLGCKFYAIGEFLFGGSAKATKTA